jgi:pyruvate kinase
MMAKTALEAESAVHYKPLFAQLRLHTPTPVNMSECVASSAVNASYESHTSAIIVLTLSGNSARLLAKYRPQCPIIGVTRNSHTARCMHLYRGCHPLVAGPKLPDTDWQGDVDARINEAIHYGLRKGLINIGDTVVCVQGWKGGSGHTNTMRLLIVA